MSAGADLAVKPLALRPRHPVGLQSALLAIQSGPWPGPPSLRRPQKTALTRKRVVRVLL